MTIRELREYISMLEEQHTSAARQWCEIFMRTIFRWQASSLQ